MVSEYYKPLNVGILFFNDHPEMFFPYSQIEVVNIPDPTGQGMEERIFAGPIYEAFLGNGKIGDEVKADWGIRAMLQKLSEIA